MKKDLILFENKIRYALSGFEPINVCQSLEDGCRPETTHIQWTYKKTTFSRELLTEELDYFHRRLKLVNRIEHIMKTAHEEFDQVEEIKLIYNAKVKKLKTNTIVVAFLLCFLILCLFYLIIYIW